MIPASLSLAEERVTDTSTSLTPEQIAERRNGIGASEVAAVLGIDPFKTAIDVWAEKTGRRPHEELAKIPRLPRNEPMTKPVWDPVWFGIRGEQEVADAFTAATGKALRRRRKAYRLKDSVMLAHCDRIVVGEDAAFEAKTTNPFQQWGRDAMVPDNYYVQCQAISLCSGKPVCYFAVRIAGQGFFHTKIEAHPGLQERIRYVVEKFWRDNVVADKMPTPTDRDDFNLIYHDTGGALEYDPEAHGPSLRRLHLARLALKWAKADKLTAETELKGILGDNQQIISPNGKPLVTWKENAKKRLDQEGYIMAMAQHFDPEQFEMLEEKCKVPVVDLDKLVTLLELNGSALPSLPDTWPARADYERAARPLLAKDKEILDVCEDE